MAPPGRADVDVLVRYRLSGKSKTYHRVVDGKDTGETAVISDGVEVSGTVTATGALSLKTAFEGAVEAREVIRFDGAGQLVGEPQSPVWPVTNYIDAIAPVLLAFASPKDAVLVASALGGAGWFKPLKAAHYRDLMAEAIASPNVRGADFCTMGKAASYNHEVLDLVHRAFEKCVAGDAQNPESWLAWADFLNLHREEAAAKLAYAKADGLLRAKGTELAQLAKQHPSYDVRLRATALLDDDAALNEVLCSTDALQIARAAALRLTDRGQILSPESVDCALRFGRFNQFREAFARAPWSEGWRGPHYQRAYPSVVQSVAALAKLDYSGSDEFFDPIDVLVLVREPRAFPLIAPLLDSSSSSVPERIYNRLKALPAPVDTAAQVASVTAISRVFQSYNELSRWYAARTLSLVNTPQSRALLEQVRDNDSDRKVRDEAARVLAEQLVNPAPGP